MNTQNISIGTTFIWIGFVSAISFMEAWLKFNAPGITIELGLGIGQVVFNALNNMELFFSLLLVGTLLSKKRNKRALFSSFLTVVLAIVVLQTAWLLPLLDARATEVINQVEIPESKLHLLFVGLEVVKVICLISHGVTLLKSKNGPSKTKWITK